MSPRVTNVIAGGILTVVIIYGFVNEGPKRSRIAAKHAALESVLAGVEKPSGAVQLPRNPIGKSRGYLATASFNHSGTSEELAKFFETSLAAQGWRLCEVMQPTIFGHKRTDWTRVFLKDGYVLNVNYMTPEAKTGWIFSLSVLHGPPEHSCD